jgi:hypothetical protein
VIHRRVLAAAQPRSHPGRRLQIRLHGSPADLPCDPARRPPTRPRRTPCPSRLTCASSRPPPPRAGTAEGLTPDISTDRLVADCGRTADRSSARYPPLGRRVLLDGHPAPPPQRPQRWSCPASSRPVGWSPSHGLTAPGWPGPRPHLPDRDDGGRSIDPAGSRRLGSSRRRWCRRDIDLAGGRLRRPCSATSSRSSPLAPDQPGARAKAVRRRCSRAPISRGWRRPIGERDDRGAGRTVVARRRRRGGCHRALQLGPTRGRGSIFGLRPGEQGIGTRRSSSRSIKRPDQPETAHHWFYSWSATTGAIPGWTRHSGWARPDQQ